MTDNQAIVLLHVVGRSGSATGATDCQSRGPNFSEETIKAVGSFYKLPMPEEVSYPTHWLNG